LLEGSRSTPSSKVTKFCYAITAGRPNWRGSSPNWGHVRRASRVSKRRRRKSYCWPYRRESVREALTGLPPWNGRILIDATNPFLNPQHLNVLDDLRGRISSEIVADLAPGARLVKAFNTMFATNLAEGPRLRAGTRRVLFVSGDDEAAKTTVTNLIESFGFATIDLGDLKVGGQMQQAKTAPLAGPDFLLPD